MPLSCRSDAGAGLIEQSRAVRPSAELGTLGWEGVDLIWADRKRYGVAGAKPAGEPAPREQMGCEASVVHPKGRDCGEPIGYEALYNGLADRFAIPATDIEFEMLRADTDPGFLFWIERRCRWNFKAWLDLNP